MIRELGPGETHPGAATMAELRTHRLYFNKRLAVTALHFVRVL